MKEAENVAKLNSKNDMNLFFNTYLLYNKLWEIKKLFGLQVLVVELVKR